jgi:hypothetical protein
MEGYLSSLRRPLSSLFQWEEEKPGIRSDPEPVVDNEPESDEDEMDLIGRFTFAPFFGERRSPQQTESRPGLMSLDHYHWLIQRYLAPHGEPTGIVAAVEPEIPPPIDRVELRSLTRGRRRRKRPSSSVVTAHPLLTEQELRQGIIEITGLNLSDRDRDIRVQKLMTENYYRIKGLLDEDNDDGRGEVDDYAEGDDDDVDEENDEVNNDIDQLSAVDAMATYTPDGLFGCDHYRRSCKLQCSTCFKWYTCRMCHDEVENHQLVRQQTKNMVCVQCKTAQPAAQECRKCGLVLARYYCDICKLWDDDPLKSIYHCDDCGICRIGVGLGKDFFHCKTCNVCMSIELENQHRCIEHSTECNCPICGEFMFTSTETVVFMKCGHSIHQSCFLEHTKTSYRCPTCARSVVNMEASFRILDAEIETQVLPEPYNRWRSVIVCNDCSAKSNVPFHFLGLKCPICRSYNSSQLKLIKPEELEPSSDRTLLESVEAALDSDVVATEEDSEAGSDTLVR